MGVTGAHAFLRKEKVIPKNVQEIGEVTGKIYVDVMGCFYPIMLKYASTGKEWQGFATFIKKLFADCQSVVMFQFNPRSSLFWMVHTQRRKPWPTKEEKISKIKIWKDYQIF
jgi:hypothetical protein